MTSYPLKGGTFQLCVRIIRPDVGSTPLKRQNFIRYGVALKNWTPGKSERMKTGGKIGLLGDSMQVAFNMMTAGFLQLC
jgi:hypothetical protein